MSGPVRKPLVDPDCYDLAEHFLADEPHVEGDVVDLSEVIQDAIELWFGGRTKGENDGIQR